MKTLAQLDPLFIAMAALVPIIFGSMLYRVLDATGLLKRQNRKALVRVIGGGLLLLVIVAGAGGLFIKYQMNALDSPATKQAVLFADRMSAGDIASAYELCDVVLIPAQLENAYRTHERVLSSPERSAFWVTPSNDGYEVAVILSGNGAKEVLAVQMVERDEWRVAGFRFRDPDEYKVDIEF